MLLQLKEPGMLRHWDVPKNGIRKQSRGENFEREREKWSFSTYPSSKKRKRFLTSPAQSHLHLKDLDFSREWISKVLCPFETHTFNWRSIHLSLFYILLHRYQIIRSSFRSWTISRRPSHHSRTWIPRSNEKTWFPWFKSLSWCFHFSSFPRFNRTTSRSRKSLSRKENGR